MDEIPVGKKWVKEPYASEFLEDVGKWFENLMKVVEE